MRLPLVVFSALLATHSVRKSYDGTTCCGFNPTLILPTTVNVAGSITYTSFDWMCGTYTRTRSCATAGLNLLAPISLYRLFGSATGGMPGTVTTGGGPLAGPWACTANALESKATATQRTANFTTSP